MEFLNIFVAAVALLMVSVPSYSLAIQQAVPVAINSIYAEPYLSTHNVSLSTRRNPDVATGQKVAVSISAQQWEAFVNKGCNLIGAMAATDSVAAEWLRLKNTAESEFKAYCEYIYKMQSFWPICVH